MHHFEFKIVPAGRWSRLQGTTPKGGSNEPRPHLLPITEAGRSLVEIDRAGFIGSTGLCPSEVTLENGDKILGYRFINMAEEDSHNMIDQLDDSVERLRRAAL